MNRVLRILGAVPGYPLRGFIIGLLWATLAFAIAAPILYLVGLESVWWIVAACFTASCLFSLGLIAIMSRPYVRDIDSIREEHLVRWEYAADEWARFEEAEWQRGQRDMRIFPIFSVVIALVVGALALAVHRDALMALAAFGLFMVIGLIVTLQTWGSARWRYANRHKAHGDVFISTTGVLQPRGYMPYNGFNVKLTKAEVEKGDPDTLRLVIGSYNENALLRTSEFRIPVPYGREDEAREVVQQLMGISAARGFDEVRVPR